MEVVQLMAFLIAHITFQIRRGFRSRIFFELKILFSLLFTTDDDALRHHQSPSPLFPLPGEEDVVVKFG